MSNPISFPNPGFQVFIALLHFFGLTMISHCISRRIQYENLTFSGIKAMPWPRLSVILMFCDSWLFLISSGTLVFGVGLEYSPAVCTIAIYLCIFFYSTTKFFVYAFLAEKVHIVWSPTVGIRRFESPVYLVCMVTVSFYCIVMTLMLGGPIHETNAEGLCVIGLKPFGSIPLLVYDVYISLFLTFMFLFPLMRSKLMSTGVRRLAVRTLIAAFVSVVTSTANVVVLMLLKGRERGWVNLGACAGDILVNAVAIFWVSGSRSSQQSATLSNATQDVRSRGRLGDSVHFAHPTSKSSPDLPEFPVYIEHGLHDTPDNMQPANSWIDRLFNRERPAPLPQLQIAVTKTFGEVSQIEMETRSNSRTDVEDKKKKHVAV
ncbi:hypothetical protein CPB83DRAFT_413614 [Crepidotus variabilis]|uniref:Transmembrane protein n=1 Tax=Crepidotus variabilis TaxID=179855 RepID=A0A9P6ESK3_9AGAR|nr:hypothetical protein CPB83DRAFT_413614 [Crepidotus variabilis]